MKRKYGNEQRESVTAMKEDLVKQLDSLYLKAFEGLNYSGFGEGIIANLTQLLLTSRDGALSPLKKSINKDKI